MDVTALKIQLEQSVKNGSLTLDATDAGLPAELQSYLKTTPSQKITLKPPVGTGIGLAGAVLTVTGTTSDTWPVQGMTNLSATLSSVTLTITDGTPVVFAVSGVGALALSPKVSAAVSIASGAKDGDPWLIQLAADAQNITPLELAQLGTVGPLPFDIPPTLDVFDRFLTVIKDQFLIAFFPATTYVPRFRVGISAPSAKWEPVKGVLALDGIDLTVYREGSKVSVRLVGHIIIAKLAIDVGIMLSGGDSCLAFLQPTGSGPFPGVMALADWAFGSDLAGQTGAGFGSVGFSPSDFDLAISRIQVEFNWRTAALTVLQISSVLSVKGLALDVMAQFPGLTITGDLKDNKPLVIKDLVGSFGLDNSAVPSTLTLNTLSFFTRLPSSFYRFAIAVDNVWAIGPLNVQEVQLALSYLGGAAGTGFQGHFDCTLDIAKITLALSVDYMAQATGWTFSGATLGDSVIKIGDLIEDLAGKFNASAPEPIKSLVLRDISVTYETGTGKFTFGMEADITVESEPVALTVTVDITPQNSNQLTAASTTYDSKFGGTIIVADLVFSLIFDQRDTTSTTFIAAYSRKDGDPPSVSLQRLVQGISSKLATAIPSGINIQLTDVKLVFVRQDQSSDFAFGLDLGLSFGLSDLPVVGHMLPPGVTLAIENLQATYSSAALTADQTSQINQLLPQHVVALPKEGLSVGINLAADIRLGSESQHLTLGVPPQNNSNAPQGRALAATAVASSSQSNTKWFTVGKSAGPISIARVGFDYQDSTLFFLLDASLNFSALQLGLDGLGLGSPLTKFDPAFHLDGISVSFSAGPVQINGGLLVVPPPLPPGVTEEYMGEVTIAIEPYLISGVAAYAKVDGDPSFFAFAQIHGEFGGPPAFFITGFMGGFGYNSQLSLPAPDQVYKFPFVAGLNDPSIFGSANPTPLDVMNALSGAGGKTAWVTPVHGEDWIAAGIMFRSFELVLGHALLAVTFGKDFEVALLGLASMSLPQGATTDAYAFVELQLEAVFKPDDGEFSVIASLTPNSFVLTKDCHLTGGFAFCLWFGSNPHSGDFVVTIGGYHPAFAPPLWYPTVPRVGFNWPVDGNVTVKGGAYFALTPTAAMAGGSLEVLFQSGDLRAWFTAYANMMVRWKPFYFTASIGISIGASYRLNLLFTSVTISVELGASLDLWGPPTGGIVHIHWVIISFSVGFGSDPIDPSALTLDWNGFQSLLPNKPTPVQNATRQLSRQPGVRRLAETADATDTMTAVLSVHVNRGLARQDQNDGTWFVRADAFVFTTQSALPANAIELSGHGLSLPDGAPAKIDIRPMGLSGIDSTHGVTFHFEDESRDLDLSTWTPATQTANLPEALWGKPLSGTASPIPSASTIPGLPTGVRLTAPPATAGPQVGPIDPSALIISLGGGFMPLTPASQADPIPAPQVDPDSIDKIAATLASPPSEQHDLVVALAALGAAPPTSSPLTQFGQQLRRYLSDPPLLAA